MSEDIIELQAMIVYLAKRIEKLEGRNRIAPDTTYLKEVRKEAEKIIPKLI